MALVIHDHRDTVHPDGSRGKLLEHEAQCCKHCGQVVVLFHPGTPEWFIRGHVHHRQCTRCNGPICKTCGEVMKATGLCNPLEARIEQAFKTGKWDANYQHQFKILPN